MTNKRETAGIVIDSWKLDIFKTILDQHAYTYDVHPGVTKDTYLIKVPTSNTPALAIVVKQANDECAKVKQKIDNSTAYGSSKKKFH